jgi:hypothetical protein
VPELSALEFFTSLSFLKIARALTGNTQYLLLLSPDSP